MASFGMMNPAYFVGKNILMDWVNNFLNIHIDKVETMANGAIYCNLFDALHPGTIPIKRVDFTVKHEFDFVKNWKLLQNGFQKAGIQKSIPVQKLVKARYQDNLEFLQWFYQYARNTYNGDPDDPTYNAVQRRAKSKGGRDYTGSSSNPMHSRNNRRARGKENNLKSHNRPISASNQNHRSSGYSNQSRSSQRSSVTSSNNNNNHSRSSNNNNANNNNNHELEELRNENKRLIQGRDTMQSKLDQLQRDHDELSAVAKDIEKERDFYFNKVLKVESLCKEHPDQSMPLLETIYNLLYQTEEEAVKPPDAAPVDRDNVNDAQMGEMTI